ncbi:MAG: phosphatase [Lachnospiraceae bacterium]|nr:phosphatase [Lachnospiraceae bacterium]
MQYVLDSHTHTLASGHAYNTIHEMVQAASEKGLHLLGITEHAKSMPGTCHEIYFANLRVLRRQMAGIEVMFGVEANIMDKSGRLDMEERLLKRMDVVVASLHIPCMTPGTEEENTEAVLGAIRNPYVNIIGHPDDGRYPLDYEKIVRAAKEHHVLLEVNNTSLNPQGFRKNARENIRTMLELCRRYEAPVILDSDAHCAEDVGNCCYSEEIIAETAFPEELIVNRSVEEYKKFINRFK